MESLIMRSILFVVALTACRADSSPGDNDASSQVDGAEHSATIISLGGDYNGNGVLTTIQLPSLEVTINAVAGVAGGDPVMRAHGDRLVILDRFGGDTVTILDRELTLLGQVSTGAGSNPQDSAIIGDVLYVVAWDAAGVLVFDLGNLEAGLQRTMDLSSLDTIDGKPDCNSIMAVGERLYVACQIMNRATFEPRGVGKVAVMNANTNVLESVLELASTNPFAQFAKTNAGDLVFSTAPGAIIGASNDTGCVERISTGTPQVEACLSNNQDHNAYARQVLPVGDSLLFVNVPDFASANIQKISEGNVTNLELPNLGINVGNITACPTGELVVDDTTRSDRGVRVYDAQYAPLHTTAIDVGWPEVFSPSNTTVCW